MIVGPAITLSLYLIGSNPDPALLGLPPNPPIGPARDCALLPAGLRPVRLGVLGSILAGVIGSLASRPPDPARVALLFDAQPPDAPAPATLDLHPERAADMSHPAN